MDAGVTVCCFRKSIAGSIAHGAAAANWKHRTDPPPDQRERLVAETPGELERLAANNVLAKILFQQNGIFPLF